MAEKQRVVKIIKSAGILTINLISNSDSEAKCSLIIPNAGAIAAPAITVNKEIDNTVAVTFLDTIRLDLKFRR